MNIQIALRLLGIAEEDWDAAQRAFAEAPAAIAEMRAQQAEILATLKALREDIYLLRHPETTGMIT